MKQLLCECHTQLQIRSYTVSINVLLRTTAVPPGTAVARISYGNSVCLSVRLSRPGTDSMPGEIETPGLHHMIA